MQHELIHHVYVLNNMKEYKKFDHH